MVTPKLCQWGPTRILPATLAGVSHLVRFIDATFAKQPYDVEGFLLLALFATTTVTCAAFLPVLG